MAAYTNPSVLVSDEELEAKIGDPNTVIIEVDEDTSLYGKGHIPGALAWSWKNDLHDGLRREFINQKQLAALLAKSGVGGDDTVVLYAGNVGLAQGVGTLVEAARQPAAKEVNFLVVGSGAASEDLRSAAKTHPNLRYLPFQPRAHVPDLYASADVGLNRERAAAPVLYVISSLSVRNCRYSRTIRCRRSS